MKEKVLLGFDFGASSGRAMAAVFKDGRLELEEVHRFPNEPIRTDRCFYWDTLRLYNELEEGIRKAVSKYGHIDSIGIDTWGVDYALISKQGTLLTNPVHYRDSRTERSIPEVHKKIPFEVLYSRTGLAHQTFNTIYQLYAEMIDRKDLFELTDRILYTPDFFAYLLTGKMYNEYTMATTGGLVSASTKKYDEKIIHELGIGAEKFPEIVYPGTVIGELSEFVCAKLEIPPVPVIAVCTHDTASAVSAIPFDEGKRNAFLISGTWSLLGIETEDAICTDIARENGFTNEGAAFGKFVFLKNITGLWLMQNLKKEWANRHEKLSYDEIEQRARRAMADGKEFIIDPNDPRFTNPLSMIDEIRACCEEKGQGIPEDVGEIALAIYNGLAKAYVDSVRGLEEVTGESIQQLNMAGGGIQDRFLSELTCDALGIPVLAGPVEASVIGNFIMQLVGLGDISSPEQGRDIVRSSFEIQKFS